MTLISSDPRTLGTLGVLDTEGSAAGMTPDLFPSIVPALTSSHPVTSAYLTVAPSGGFWSNSTGFEFEAILSSCFQWLTAGQATEPRMPRLSGSVRTSRVVGRRRLEPAPLDESDFT